MKFIIILIVILAVMYVLMYIKQKKRNKEKKINTVEEFRSNYIQRREEMQKRRETAHKNTNYVTKYNSCEDYREK